MVFLLPIDCANNSIQIFRSTTQSERPIIFDWIETISNINIWVLHIFPPQLNRYEYSINLPVIIFFTINISVSCKASELWIQTDFAFATFQAIHVPLFVHSHEVVPVQNPRSAPGTKTGRFEFVQHRHCLKETYTIFKHTHFVSVTFLGLVWKHIS